jgi:two pore calcium channel protein 1
MSEFHKHKLSDDRIMRDIFYSLIPILDMLLLVMFFLTIFSLFGYFLFSNVENDQYFQTFKSSFVQMFVLLTTANHPDIMTVEYDQFPASPIFFDIFLLIGLYLLLNLFLAVVYGTFGDHEKDKFKKLYLHKRASLIRAFNVIVKKSNVMKFKQFERLMAHFKPRMNPVEVTCCFKALSNNDNGTIKLRDFLSLFSYCDMNWAHIKKGREQGRWYDMRECPVILSKCGKVAGRIVEHKYFSRLVGFVLISNLVALLFEAVYAKDPVGQAAKFDNVDYLFLICMAVT